MICGAVHHIPIPGVQNPSDLTTAKTVILLITSGQFVRHKVRRGTSEDQMRGLRTNPDIKE